MTDDKDADEVVHLIASNWREAPLKKADLALCAFAEKLTNKPEEMSQSDVAQLHAHGFDDRAVHDATQIIGYFNYINRVADGLGIDDETFTRPWEDPNLFEYG